MLRLDSGPVRNEVRAINKLCNGTHKNIVEVFKVGEFSDSSYLYIDMELCAMNLEEYNRRVWAVNPIQREGQGFWDAHIWSIMRQISDGLAFIHSNHEVHRDLKPRNGETLSSNSDY